MKKDPLLLPAILALVTIFAAASCSDNRPKEKLAIIQTNDTAGSPATSSSPSPAVSTEKPELADPLVDMSVALQSATLEKASTLSDEQERMDRSLDEQIATWKAHGKPVIGTNFDKLTLARSDFAEKIKILASASPETWASTKENALVSLQNLKAAYVDLKAGT